jgi:hypothetical protein
LEAVAGHYSGLPEDGCYQPARSEGISEELAAFVVATWIFDLEAAGNWGFELVPVASKSDAKRW